MGTTDPIRAALEIDEALVIDQQNKQTGPIGKLLTKYRASEDRLLGFILDMSYDEATIVTCDAWKRKCGGVPKNSFIIIRLNPTSMTLSVNELPRPSLILARITEPVATPLTAEIQQTIFAIHKVQASLDPYTNTELQWGALKATILGTYYDNDKDEITFGNDIDSYMSAHFYEVYVPNAADLETLINSFVSKNNPITIGNLRYTETQTTKKEQHVPIKVTPFDFTSNRTALFGKTRMGKSNTIKVIADMILRSGINVGQVIFDLNGEYSGLKDLNKATDNASLFALHMEHCVRYTLNPNPKKLLGVPDPFTLKANFYKQIELGHSIITSLFNDEFSQKRPNYIIPLLDWEPCDPERLKNRFPDTGDQKRYWRAQSMYFAALAKAGYEHPSTMTVMLNLNKSIRIRLGQISQLKGVAQLAKGATLDSPEISDSQPIGKAIRVYEQLYKLWTDAKKQGDGEVAGAKSKKKRKSDQSNESRPMAKEDANLELWSDELENEEIITEEADDDDDDDGSDAALFPLSRRTGDPYFNPIHECLLRIIGDTSISGTQYLMRFSKYHHLLGSSLDKDIVRYVNEGKTVIIDLANADEVITRYYSELVSRAIFHEQTTKFTHGTLDEQEHSVLFYFEEAHNLFRKDDKDLRSIYNRLAKEGAKNRIGMVYATQSMTTLSPDLLKNTENFFIAHLNDDREIRELTNQYEFKDIALDVQRSKTKGYVRMITLSHRYALPVQISLFGSNAEEGKA